MAQKWPKMIWNGYTNAPNVARNTNTKFPDQKLWNIDEKLGEITKKIAKKWPKMVKNGPEKNVFPNIHDFEQFSFYGPTKISLSKCAKLIGQSQKLTSFQI